SGLAPPRRPARREVAWPCMERGPLAVRSAPGSPRGGALRSACRGALAGPGRRARLAVSVRHPRGPRSPGGGLGVDRQREADRRAGASLGARVRHGGKIPGRVSFPAALGAPLRRGARARTIRPLRDQSRAFAPRAFGRTSRHRTSPRAAGQRVRQPLVWGRRGNRNGLSRPPDADRGPSRGRGVRSWLGAHRAILVLAGFLLIGALVGQVVSERVSDREEPKLTSTDAQRDGALALALLVERLGYRVQRLDHSSDALDGSAGGLFVLWPVRPFEEAETSGLVNWVESGGVLVYLPAPGLAATGIGQGSQDALSRQLEIRLTPVPWTESARSTPGLMPAESVFAVASSWALELGNDAWVPLLAEEGRVFGAARGLGTGRVYVASSDALFANQSIATDANATFAVHAVAQIPRSKSVVFEESHHAPSAAQNLTSAART